MPTLDEVRQAIRNAQAAGDTAAAQKLTQYAVQLRMQQEPPQRMDATEGMSTRDKLLAGVGRGMMNVARHAGNLVGLVSDEELAEAKRLDADLMNTGAGQVGSFVGEMAALPVPMAGTTGALARFGGRAGEALTRTAVRRGALEGAVQGALMADPGNRIEGAMYGGAFGSALPAAAAGVSKIARGVTRTPEAQALLDRGVDLTPGQMNPRGVLAKLEEDWQSVPILGRAISEPRAAARQQWQQRVVQEGAAPGAQIPIGDIDVMLDAAYRSFEPLYDQARGFPVAPVVMRAQGGDQPLSQLFRSAATTRSVRATEATRKSVDRWLQNQITQFDGTSDGLLAMRSQIRAEARKARLAAGGEDRAAAELLERAEQAVTDALESQLPRDALQALRLADSKYGTYKLIEDAVAASKDAPGGFTPNQLSTAVKRATEKGAYARGAGGTLRDLAAQGREAFDVRSPPTGQRLASIGLPIAAGMLDPSTALPIAGAFLGMTGTQTGRRLAAGATAPQQRLAQALSRIEQLPAPTLALTDRYARALIAAGTNE